ncbi:hypothetical protein VNO78_24585 [Psophocarpus tetragonolobus]|uniref:Uncharacterized protein n=1 Tax=Psophocarpus tetragonolobus TaxID=3891 RepID=A0AAN9XEM9_PSOTE
MTYPKHPSTTLTGANRTQDCLYHHRNYGYLMEECTTLKDMIEDFIRSSHLKSYVSKDTTLDLGWRGRKLPEQRSIRGGPDRWIPGRKLNWKGNGWRSNIRSRERQVEGSRGEGQKRIGPQLGQVTNIGVGLPNGVRRAIKDVVVENANLFT